MLEVNKIHQGDCLELMKDIPTGSIDLILCDLPYGTTRNKWDSIIPLDELWGLYERVIKERGAIALTSSQPFTTVLNYSNLQNYKYEWIWNKSNSTGFQLANKRPMKKHEIVSVFYKKQPRYNPQGLIPHGKVNRRGRTGDNWSEMGSDEYVQKWTNFPTQSLSFAYDMDKFHPTQKPVALFEYLIKTYTNEGETVLDNCIGSGTTAIACINSNRSFIGIEQEQKYVDIANERIGKQGVMP